MPLTVSTVTQFKGWAVRPEDIQVGEAASTTLPVVSPGGQLLEAKFVRKRLQLTILGLNYTVASDFVTAADQANLQIFQGSPTKEDIAIKGQTIAQAVLVSADITEPLQIGPSLRLVQKTELVYESQVFV